MSTQTLEPKSQQKIASVPGLIPCDSCLSWSDLAWDTPIGTMTGQIGPAGVRLLHFPRTADGLKPGTSRTVSQLTSHNSQPATQPMADAVTQFLSRFFAGDHALASDGIVLDYAGATPFEVAVWEATRRIPFGQTRSYGQIAAAIGKPGSARAVGGALGRNPLVLLVPCHRVIASTPGPRALCGFTGGLALKQYLLSLEGLEFEI